MYPECLVLKPQDHAVALIPRNVPASWTQLLRPFVWLPQNALPWGPPVSGERGLQGKLRLASGFVAHRATAMVRISGALPRLHSAPTSDVLHNVLDESFEECLQAEPSSDGRGAFVCIGSAHSYRNMDRLVEAYASYRREGGRSRLVLQLGLGTPDRHEALYRLASSVDGVDIRVRPASRAQVVSLMKSARGVLFPSIIEASPVTLLEAHAVGALTACSDIVAHRELGEAGDAFFDPYDVRAISVTMHWLDDAAPVGWHRLQDRAERQFERIRWTSELARFIGRIDR